MTSLNERFVCFQDQNSILFSNHLQIYDQPKYGIVLVVVTINGADQEMVNKDGTPPDFEETLFTNRICYLFDRMSLKLITKVNIDVYDQNNSYIEFGGLRDWILSHDNDNIKSDRSYDFKQDLEKFTLNVIGYNYRYSQRISEDRKCWLSRVDFATDTTSRVVGQNVNSQSSIYLNDKQMMHYHELYSDSKWCLEWNFQGTNLINMRCLQQSLYGISFRSVSPIDRPLHSPDGKGILLRWQTLDNPQQQWIQFLDQGGLQAGQSFSEVNFLTQVSPNDHTLIVIPPICLNQDSPWIVRICFDTFNVVEVYDKKQGNCLQIVPLPHAIKSVRLLTKGLLLYGHQANDNHTVELIISDILWRTHHRLVLAQRMHRDKHHILFERFLFHVICSFLH